VEMDTCVFGLHVFFGRRHNPGAGPAASDIIVINGVREFAYLGCKFSTNTISAQSVWRIALTSSVMIMKSGNNAIILSYNRGELDILGMRRVSFII